MITRLTALPPAGVTRTVAGITRTGVGVLRSSFAPLSLGPSVFSEAGTDMLKTGPATAEYLDLVPTLTNRGTGSDSTQATAANQPVALPLIGGAGYLHLPGVAGNYASVPDAADLDGFGDFTLQVDDVVLDDWTSTGDKSLVAKSTGSNASYIFKVSATDGKLDLLISFDGSSFSTYVSTAATSATDGAPASFKVIRTGSDIKFYEDTGSGFAQLGATVSGVSTTLFAGAAAVEVGSFNGGLSSLFPGSIGRARIWSDATQTTNVLDIDFSLAAHKATSFTATSGQTVTINQSGDNPADIIARPVLRLDGIDDYLAGTFAALDLTVGGTMFLVASVLGAGGEAGARLLSTWVTGDGLIDGFIFSWHSGADLLSYNAANLLTHTGGYTGRFLHEVSAFDLDSTSLLNNAGEQTSAKDLSAVASTDFAIGAQHAGSANPAIDLELILLYPRVLTAAESTNVRSWISTNYATH
tara:strand:- start:18162 stop:19571 length:1410 start_codon:yes stop_codon:yes gene_type:complete